MRLWSFQQKAIEPSLRQTGILQTPWRLIEGKQWKAAFQWMAQLMKADGLDCGNFAPIWAWHSCSQYGQAPTLGDARNLFNDLQLEPGIITIEFECPPQYARCSYYNKWNDVLEHFLEGHSADTVPPKLNHLFEVVSQELDPLDAIQATLPYLKMDWVIDIRPLPLTPEMEDFDGTLPA